MTYHFTKYQGTGNDFIMFNNMKKKISFTPEQIQFLCHRKLGIGADGLILIEPDKEADFYMNYYNSDGTQSFCGNGSRCAVRFSSRESVFLSSTCKFRAIDGMHEGEFMDTGDIKVSMSDVNGVEKIGDDSILNTGSPHYVKICNAIEDIDILAQAHAIRYNNRFSEKGINVNFVSQKEGKITMRTYERGVEDETLSCGTGVTAAALALSHEEGKYLTEIHTRGGVLGVSFIRDGSSFSEIYLMGKASEVFKGKIKSFSS